MTASATDAATDLMPSDELLCPITHKLFRNPVILMSGHAVDLAALIKFWRTCPFKTCNPITRERMATLEELALIPGLCSYAPCCALHFTMWHNICVWKCYTATDIQHYHTRTPYM